MLYGKFNWENPEIFKINKEDGHAIMMPFDSEKDALSAKESNYKQSLNGKWKFYWQRGLKINLKTSNLRHLTILIGMKLTFRRFGKHRDIQFLTIMQVHFLRLSVAQKENSVN